MSYCRWSSNDFGCDLYCYESDRGFETHVAGLRPVGDVPRVPVVGSVASAEWLAAMKAQAEFLDSCVRVRIGLPHDGESFCDETLVAFRERLMALRALGYRFPDYVLDKVLDELTVVEP